MTIGGDYELPCPYCGGVVHCWYFGCDDSYAPPSWGIQCKGCKREFTQEQLDNFEKNSKKPHKRVKAGV